MKMKGLLTNGINNITAGVFNESKTFTIILEVAQSGSILIKLACAWDQMNPEPNSLPLDEIQTPNLQLITFFRFITTCQ